MTFKNERINKNLKYLITVYFVAFTVLFAGSGMHMFVALMGAFVMLVLAFAVCMIWMSHETGKLRKINQHMNETKEMDGYIEAMQKIGKRTVWGNVYYQTILNQGTGYINLGEYRKAIEVMDELELFNVPSDVRFLEIWNRLFALIELRSYGQAEKLMKKYDELLTHYAKVSEGIADRLQLFRYLMAGDNEAVMESIRETREKCTEKDQDILDLMDYYEIRLCQVNGDHDRAEELKANLRGHKVFPCIAKAI